MIKKLHSEGRDNMMNWGSILKFGVLGLFIGIGMSLFIPTVFIESKTVGTFSSVTTYHTTSQTILNIAKYGVLGAGACIAFSMAYQLRNRQVE
ncbi:hypothetical protein [Alkalicoccobacillus porphyridii]|uniref:Uncharacterized protein n=1 Tax=Alkalicoccobacillus porphyridii TaxID=2597270 RepID=A0A553ZX20_9BACI|nr:hypothetical protein [Alkalicoccobacillus porphyridii]TSB45935.1 hypothetical protein FN960_13575 [Alkalicoccobacillus porphyridii]